MNIEEVKKHIEYLRSDKHDREFYVALLLYDVLGLYGKDITEEDINKAYEISDDYDSIYNEDMRDRLKEEIDIDTRERDKEEQEEELTR